MHYQWQERYDVGGQTCCLGSFPAINSSPIKRKEHSYFHSHTVSYCLLALLHRNLMKTPALRHMRDNERREHEEMASQGTRLVTHASATTVNANSDNDGENSLRWRCLHVSRIQDAPCVLMRWFAYSKYVLSLMKVRINWRCLLEYCSACEHAHWGAT